MSNVEGIKKPGSFVMLSEAKHLKLLSSSGVTNNGDQRFFASLRMKALRLFRHLIIRPCFELRHSSFVICLVLGLLAGLGTAFAEKRAITEKDLWDFVWIGDTQVSPDGARVVFVRVTVNEKKEGYNTSIWAVSTSGSEGPHRLTSGEHDSSPRWSPDGKYVVFTRATEKDGKSEPPQLFMLSMTGGDAFSFTTLPKGASDPRWSPGGKVIAFTSTTNPEDLVKQEK